MFFIIIIIISFFIIIFFYIAEPQSSGSNTFYVSHRKKRPSGEDVATGAIAKKVSPLPRRDARQIYNPPSGKYSATIGNFSYGEFGKLELVIFIFIYICLHKIWCYVKLD